MSEESTCRHEYIVIYQRKLKGIDRRLVGTRAFLPVGFKMADFKYLSPGSFVFCSRCRKRLFPKRTQAEKEAARIERKQLKELELEQQRLENLNGLMEQEKLDMLAMPDSSASASSNLGWSTKASPGQVDDSEEDDDDDDDEDDDDELDDDSGADVNVDELEVESVDVEDIKAEGVKIATDEDDDSSCDFDVDEDD